MRYFDQAGPLHHQDEESHVFPVLLATPDTGLHRVVRRLQQDHRDMEAHWAQARVVLQRIQQPSTAAWRALSPEEANSLTAFAGLYDAHIEAENQQVYPAVQVLLSEQARQNMSADMMTRRGVDTPVKR
jgi:hemerythrin-like domain-containing protein